MLGWERASTGLRNHSIWSDTRNGDIGLDNRGQGPRPSGPKYVRIKLVCCAARVGEGWGEMGWGFRIIQVRFAAKSK